MMLVMVIKIMKVIVMVDWYKCGYGDDNNENDSDGRLVMVMVMVIIIKVIVIVDW